MASHSPDQTTASAEAITFEVEKMATDGHGRLVVTGRWFGVRGRRFMRPTLTLTMRGEDGAERRALADLEHKPWAPEDGKSWIAAFEIEAELGDASEIELAVAPDIAVDLADSASDAANGSRGGGRGGLAGRAGRGARGGRGGGSAQPPTAREARAPRVRAERVQARPSTVDHAREIERLKARASTAEQATEREHARRGAAEQALEQERAESLKLRSELGRIRAELDIAATTRTELAATSAELDKIRSEARETGGRLQATVRALDQQRAESERLRMRLTAAEATIKPVAHRHREPDHGGLPGPRHHHHRQLRPQSRCWTSSPSCPRWAVADISGGGTGFVTVRGVSQLTATEHTVMPDRIDAGVLAMAAAITGGELTCRRLPGALRGGPLEARADGRGNRVELYVGRVLDHPTRSAAPLDGETVVAFLAEFHGIPVEEIRPHLYVRQQTDAVRHLFRVAASLDSLIVGEGQIAGQVKKAYELGQKCDVPGPMLHALFPHARRVAERVRTETGIARGHVSVSSAAVDYVRQVFDHFGDKTVLVIGAGKMGELTLCHLRPHGAERIFVVNRSPEKALAVAKGCGGEAVPWDRLDEMLARADIVLSTTGAPEPVVTLERYRRIAAQRTGGPLVVLDIAVPRDFDPRIHDGDRTCLFNIDDLKRIQEATLSDRRKHVGPAEAVVEQETHASSRNGGGGATAR